MVSVFVCVIWADICIRHSCQSMRNVVLLMVMLSSVAMLIEESGAKRVTPDDPCEIRHA